MRLRHMMLGVTVGLLAAGPMWAQQPGRGGLGGGGFGRTGGMIMMITQSKQLQDELKMDQDQVEKVGAAISKVREEMRDEMSKLRSQDTSPEDRAAIMKKYNDANNQAVHAVLKPEQLKRLTQIENQQAGIGLFSKEDAQKALKLTSEQKEKITAINEALTKDMAELRGTGGRGGFDPQAPTKMQALRKEALEKTQAVLTDDQKNVYRDLVGAPFQLQFAGAAGGAAPGGLGGFGGGFARMQPGQILSAPIQTSLKLTDEQKKQVDELQKEIDAKLDKILTDEQKKQLKDMQQGGGARRFGARPGAGNNPPPRQ